MADPKITADRPIVTRKQAKAACRTRYFTGKPCKHGHVDERLTASGQCITCGLARHRAWYAANREHSLAYAAAWAKANPDRVIENDRRRNSRCPGRTSAQSKAWRKAHAEQERLRKSAWKKANPDKVRAGARCTYQKNPAKHVARAHKRRALKIANGGTYSADDVIEIRKMQRDKCAVCRKVLRRGGQIDHIVALINGGANARSNLQLLCPPCNQRKGARDPIDFMRGLGRLL